MSPQRIQRKRSKGWRMPKGAVYVGRPSRWGNPYHADECGECLYEVGHLGPHVPLGDEGLLREYRSKTVVDVQLFEPELLKPLRGRDLACWCPLDQPCHADVLLELANA